MRVGIYGGTFDPIHVGHLVLAEQCREQCQLDEVWFVPALHPPHKTLATISSAESRCEMIRMAIADNRAFRLSTIELERSGPSFTVLTLELLAAEHVLGSAREFFLLIGADSLRDFHLWREPARILELATVVAVNRGNQTIPDLTELRVICGDLINTRIVYAQMPSIDVSATDIRHRVLAGQSIRYLVSGANEEYIRKNRLYTR